MPESGFLRDPKTGDLLRSPFMSGIVAIIFVTGVLVGLAYGLGAGTLSSDADVVKAMAKAMETLGAYLVLVFFAAQFVAFFNWTNLGLIVAIKGAELLKTAGLGTIPLLVAFVVRVRHDQPVHGQRLGEVGDHGAGVRADVHAARLHAGTDADRVPHRRQLDQHHLADDVLLRPDHRVHAALRARPGSARWSRRCCRTRSTFLVCWTLLLIVWILLGLPVGPDAPIYLEPRPAP